MKPSLGSCGGCCAAPPPGGVTYANLSCPPAVWEEGRRLQGPDNPWKVPGSLRGTGKQPGSWRPWAAAGPWSKITHEDGCPCPQRHGRGTPKSLKAGPLSEPYYWRRVGVCRFLGARCWYNCGGGFDKTMTRIREQKLVGVPGALEGPRKGAAPGLRPHRLPCRPVCVRVCVRPSV